MKKSVLATLWKNVEKRNMIFESSTNARNIHVNTKIKNDRCKILYWNTSHVSRISKWLREDEICHLKLQALMDLFYDFLLEIFQKGMY